jgi:hypothetical protein
MPSWFTITKNEYLLLTGGMRKHRKLIPLLLIVIPAIVFFIVIQISNSSYISNTSVQMFRNFFGIPSIGAYSFYPQADITLVIGEYVSLIGLIAPVIEGLSNVLWETPTEDMEILLSSPIKPRHIFLGELVLNLIPLPIYLSILSVSLIPIILEHGYTGPLFLIAFFLTVGLIYTAGTWIGLLLSYYLKLRRQSSHRFVDLAMVIIALGALTIGLTFFVLSSSQTSVFNIWFSPTTWVSNIIYYALTGSNITTINYLGFTFYIPLTPDPITSLVLTIAFFSVIFVLGLILISRVKMLELIPGAKVSIKKEEGLYRFLRRLSSGKLARLTVVQLKEFSRNPESLLRVIAIFFFPLILYFISVISLIPSFSANVNILSLLLSPGIAFVFMTTVGGMIGQIEASQMTLSGKEVIQIYQRVPHGVKLLVYSKFLEMLTVGLPLGLIMGIIFQIFLGSQSPGIQVLVPVMLFIVVVSCAIALGVYSARPVLKWSGRGQLINATIIDTVVSVVGSLMLIFALFPWIINIVFSNPLQSTLIQIFPYFSNLLQAFYSEFPIIPKEYGIIAAIAIGVVASYISLRVGMSKLHRFE